MSDDRFDVVVHHGGIFVQNHGLHYMNGEKSHAIRIGGVTLKL